MPTMEDIRAMLAHPAPAARGHSVIGTGSVTTGAGELVGYEVFVGWSLGLAYSCEDSWGAFEARLLRFLKAQRLEAARLRELLAQLRLPTLDWKASLALAGAAGHWYSIMAQGKPQAVCRLVPVARPASSSLQTHSDWHVESMEVAPWNIDTPMGAARLRGMDELLLLAAMGHARGFSLGEAA